jgi:hypothetical protein
MIDKSANYRMPPMSDQTTVRCRSCAEAQRAGRYGNTIGCKYHRVTFVRHSHTCDNAHTRGTLL